MSVCERCSYAMVKRVVSAPMMVAVMYVTMATACAGGQRAGGRAASG